MAPQQNLHELEPDCLPAGTEIGAWRVLALRGKGAYGAVYRVTPVGEEGGKLFALKLALHPEDPRFEREVELLSRIRHPNVPRLKSHGLWEHPTGRFPFLVMEWVEGVPLYDWAREHKACWRQVMRVLAQVAQALEATHGVDGVHRDVKGGNVLVQPEDGRAMLLDFGAGDFRGARTLTQEVLPPCTPQYRSPEAQCYQWLHYCQRGAHYEPGPADDVYALGVTAYRLLTDSYPPAGVEPRAAVEGRIILRPVPELPKVVARACPELAGLVHQMLSREPSSRGSAAEVARKLQRAAETAGTGADLPLPPRQAPAAVIQIRSEKPWRSRRARGMQLAMTAGIIAGLLLYGGWSTWWQRWEQPGGAVAQRERDGGVGDAGTARLAEEALAASIHVETPEPSREGFGVEVPKKPLPGQKRAPCKRAVAINGGCWLRPEDSRPPCTEGTYEWKGDCYFPVLGPQPPPATSQPRSQ